MSKQTINRTEQTMVRLTPPVRHELEAIAAEQRRECRFGSLADITLRPRHVCFTPKSGHRATVANADEIRFLSGGGPQVARFKPIAPAKGS